MSLGRLADHISRQSVGTLTPTMVVPEFVSFREPFFVALAKEISERMRSEASVRSLRFDWLIEPSVLTSFWGNILGVQRHWSTIQRAKRINRSLQLLSNDYHRHISLELSATIGRSWVSSVSTTMVVGCCNSADSLPEWTSPINLSAFGESIENATAADLSTAATFSLRE